MIFKSPLSSFSTSEIIFILISSCRFLNLDLVTTPPKLRFSPFCSPASHLLFFFESLGLLSIPCRLIDASFGLSKKFRIRLVFIRRRFSHCQIYVKCYHHIDRYDSKKSAHQCHRVWGQIGCSCYKKRNTVRWQFCNFHSIFCMGPNFQLAGKS